MNLEQRLPKVHTEMFVDILLSKKKKKEKRKEYSVIKKIGHMTRIDKMTSKCSHL